MCLVTWLICWIIFCFLERNGLRLRNMQCFALCWSILLLEQGIVITWAKHNTTHRCIWVTHCWDSQLTKKKEKKKSNTCRQLLLYQAFFNTEKAALIQVWFSSLSQSMSISLTLSLVYYSRCTDCRLNQQWSCHLRTNTLWP